MIENLPVSEDYLFALYEISREINSDLSLQVVLDRIADRIVRSLNAEKVLVLLTDPERGVLVPRTARSMDAETIDAVTVMSRSTVEKVKETRKAVLLLDTQDSPDGVTSSIKLHQIVSIICVPIGIGDRLLGAVYADTRDPEYRFRREQLPFLEAFGNLAGIAIRNAQAHEELAALNRDLESVVQQRTLEIAQKHKDLQASYRELENAQLQLVRAEKMASLGKLVSGIAHEMNTPVGSLKSSIQTIRSAGKKLDEWRSSRELAAGDGHQLDRLINAINGCCDSCLSSSDRINRVIQALRQFARLDEGTVQSVDLNDVLNVTIGLLLSQYGDRIAIEVQSEKLPHLTCRAADLNQVFMTLLSNACEAIPDTGAVTVSVKRLGEQVQVRIIDSGMGIARGRLASLFDPTLERDGDRVGMGLGLPIAYRIVEEHGGSIAIDSEEGKGTVVSVLLPLEQRAK